MVAIVQEKQTLRLEHITQLKNSGLTDEQIAATGHRSVDTATAKHLTGHELPGLLFNYFDPHGKPYRCGAQKWEKKPFSRLKPDWHLVSEAIQQRYLTKYGDLPKYLSPGSVGNRPYFSRLQPDWPTVCRKASIAIDITEGEKKGDTANAHGFPTIALSGVTCQVDHSPRDEWLADMGSQWDVDEPDAAPKISRFLPELEQLDPETNTGVIDWRFRSVGIVFDSDITSKYAVSVALERLCAHVRGRDGRPFPVLLPNEANSDKNGLDDFIKRHGPQAYAELRAAFLQLQQTAQRMVDFTSGTNKGTPVEDGAEKEEAGERCIFTLKEPNPHIKSLMAWTVLKEEWAYRPGIGWYRWIGTHWSPVSDSVEFEGALIQFCGAQGWLSQSGSLLSYAEKYVKSRVIVPEAQWDCEDYLGFKNGVLNLETGTFQPHKPEFHITSILPYDYNPLALCPTWLKFLEEVTGGDRQLIELLQAWCKWIVSPKAKNSKSPIEKSLDLIGRKGTGKSTFLDVLYALVGEGNYGDATPETFATPIGLGQLLDKKLAVDADASGYLSHVGHFNKVVSNEPVTVKKLFRDTATLRLGVVVVRAYNDFPSVPSSGSEGLDRRLCVIPFRHQPRVPDIHLTEKLQAEMSGIFAWCWQLSKPEMLRRILWSGSIAAVQQASIERFEADHPEYRFLRDDFPYGHDGIQAFDLFERYVDWCKRNNHRPVSNTNFGRQMNELGIPSWKGIGGCIFYQVPRMEEFDLISYLRIQPGQLLTNVAEGLETKSTPTDPSKEGSNLGSESVSEGSEGSEGLFLESEACNPYLVCVSEGSEGFEPILNSINASPASEDSEKPSMSHSAPQVGDTVLVMGAGKWIRHGSDKLPWQEVPKRWRSAPEIPLSALSDRLFLEIQDGGKVLSLSRDGQRVRVKNQATGRVSVLAVGDVRVLRLKEVQDA
jgi:P4 family phage/plasmid primase-like protien